MKNELIKRRIRAKISGTATVPRVVIFRSNKYLYLQAINDEKGETLAAGSELKDKENMVKIFVKILSEKKIKKIVFDRAGYQYHGNVKKIAEDLRKNGLEF
ncbi:MAG: 50S ribosomal protein L18 [Berkelbacteria bacterium GW2011_GWA1_36_9]|uniref:50S ribosomal protein L18 n=1 Tax=Berkelbacteria bacterium GW2011_GWA1_36_9 TaxID=1618331 RepID=A0A0G0FWK3_9BACT|nr:MAG: 50S ribosomal protein L18 [Berkelbacteria bacterium GW2011_GWA1_36_9]